jgi:hypothetical protein
VEEARWPSRCGARRLTDQEGQRLQQIVRRGKHGTVRMRRAMIIMASASGTLVLNRPYGLSSRRPGPRPEKLGQPFTRWSLRKLASYLADGPQPVIIGRERLRQILHARGISFQRTRTWKESTDPDRDAKLDRIEYVTSHYPDRCFAFDQFGPLSIRPCHGTCWAPRKHPVRLRATYHRTHGIRYFHGCYSLADDQLWGVTHEHKGAGHTLAALKSIRAARPGGYRLFVIL